MRKMRVAGGSTPLDLACSIDETEIADEIANLLRKHGGKHRNIYYAVKHGDVEGVKEFLAAGVDVNEEDNMCEIGNTPLEWANSSNQTEIANLLRKHGAKTRAELMEAERK